MNWPPVSSEEAAELREIEQAKLDADKPPTHDPNCVGGWLGEDLDGCLIPCLICRPHLIDMLNHPNPGGG